MSKRVTPDKLVDDLQLIVHDAEALLKASAEQTGEKIQQARARAEVSLRRVKARLNEVEDEVLKRERALVDETDDYVRTKPWQVVGAAIGVGFLLGLMLSRR